MNTPNHETLYQPGGHYGRPWYLPSGPAWRYWSEAGNPCQSCGRRHRAHGTALCPECQRGAPVYVQA